MHQSLKLSDKLVVDFDHLPIKKCKGFSSYFFTTFPIKNLLPNKSGVMKVPYFAMPISYGVNSTQSESIKKIQSIHRKYYRNVHSYRSLQQ